MNNCISVWAQIHTKCHCFVYRTPLHERVFHRNSNSMENSFHSHLDSDTVIATKFCTWHDSCAVVSLCCGGMCKNLLRSDGQQRNYGKAKFPSNLNCDLKNASETGPWITWELRWNKDHYGRIPILQNYTGKSRDKYVYHIFFQVYMYSQIR